MKYHQGKFSPKNPEKYIGDSTKIFYRSGWEKKTMLFFDNNESILEWGSEEIIIPYLSPVDNRIHRYFPDFVVVSKSADGKINRYLVEVKPKAQTLPPKMKKKATPRMLTEIMTYEVNQAKWAAAEHWCKTKKMSFLILTEEHIKP